MSKAISHLELYRLPWNLCDNGISWLEPTFQCNLACDGCYRRNRREHKPWEETLRELDVFDRVRRSDALSIAGGDPLLYPDIVPTVAEARRRGYKPIINTNGSGLTPELLHELRDAGLAGFTFHVDSRQGRPGRWRGKGELELNELRDELCDAVASIGVACAFNATVYPDTLRHVAPLSRWAEERIDRVHTMVFILYRDAVTSGLRYFSGRDEVRFDGNGNGSGSGDGGAGGPGEPDRLVYNRDVDRPYTNHVTADDAIAALRAADPRYRPAGYLNGSEDPEAFKWLLAGRVGRPGRTYGWVGARFMEAVQTGHHLFTGRYLAYASPATARAGKPLLLLSALDPGVRAIAREFLADAARRPLAALARPLHYQSIAIIQPVDIMQDGRMSMCDGCPDMTVWNGRLVWSCRMEELERFGRNLRVEPVEG